MALSIRMQPEDTAILALLHTGSATPRTRPPARRRSRRSGRWSRRAPSPGHNVPHLGNARAQPRRRRGRERQQPVGEARNRDDGGRFDRDRLAVTETTALEEGARVVRLVLAAEPPPHGREGVEPRIAAVLDAACAAHDDLSSRASTPTGTRTVAPAIITSIRSAGPAKTRGWSIASGRASTPSSSLISTNCGPALEATRALRRHTLSNPRLTPLRRATSDVFTSGSALSARIRAFSASLQSRRRRRPVITSTR